MTKTLVVLSGGQDSTTCLFVAKEAGYEVHAVTFDYGQRHRVEIEAAKTVAKLAGVASHEIIQLSANILKSTSPLVDKQQELEQYPDENLPGGLEKTFVPMRNQLFFTVAFNRAVRIGATTIYTGVAQEDYGGYPDCRRTFVDWIEQASNVGLGYTYLNAPKAAYIRIRTPLMNMSKAETVELALRLPGCYGALAYSHTAYDGRYPPLGNDHATVLRRKGFDQAEVPDPLVLRALMEGAWPVGERMYPHETGYGNKLSHVGPKYLDMVAETMRRVEKMRWEGSGLENPRRAQ